jgi:hypothetical protein
MAPKPLFLLSSLALPATALLISAYLYNAPLSARKTRTIQTSNSLSATCSTSDSLHHIVNPRNHISATDSRRIILSKTEVGNLTDEEILARFLRGFYGGWIFAPEKALIGALRVFGRKLVAVGFTGTSLVLLKFSMMSLEVGLMNLGVPMNGPEILSPADISRTKLPEKFTVLLGGNFIVLDKHLTMSPSSSEKEIGQSFIEVGFGDNRRQFAGLHRFEVTRDVSLKREDGKDEGAIELCYSSISCNPTVNRLPFPLWVFGFHTFYAQSLFRDGVREVLSK